MPSSGVWNFLGNPQSDTQRQLLEMSLPSRISTVGLACDSSPFNDASTTRNKSKNPYSKSVFNTQGIPSHRSTLELECVVLPFSDKCTSPMKGTSQAPYLSSLYNRYNSYTHTSEWSNERCTEQPVLSSTDGINEYRKNQIVDYSHPCTCRGNVCHCYTVCCIYGDHLHYPNPRRLEGESQEHHGALQEKERRHRMEQISPQFHFPKGTEEGEKTDKVEIKRRHRMEQISKQCHFPPRTEECEIIEDGKIERRRRMEQISKQCHLPPRTQERLSAYHDTVFGQQSQYFSTEVSQQTPGRSHFTTAEVNACLTQKPNSDNNALGIHTHTQCYLQTLKNDYEENEGNTKRRKIERNRVVRKVTSPKPIHSLVKKGFRQELQKGGKFQTKNQTSLCQEMLTEHEHVKTKTMSGRLERTCDPETFIHSTSSSHETSNGHTLIATNQDSENLLRAFPLENSVSAETIYDEDDTAYSDFGGYSFDHNYLPKIVAVHSITDCQKHTWDELRGAKDIFLTEKMPWNELDGLSSSNGGGSHKRKREQSSSVSIFKQNLPEQDQVNFEQSAVHASTDKPARCSHTSKTEVLLSRTSCGVQNNTDDNSVIYSEYTDHNKDLEIPLLPRNEPCIFTEKKPQSLPNEETIKELCHKIERFDQRIKKEKITYKKDILYSTKKVLVTRLRKLQDMPIEMDIIKRKFKTEEAPRQLFAVSSLNAY